MRMTIMPGVASLLADAHRSETLYKSLKGDLGQMAAQERYLLDRGFDMRRSGGIPGFRTKEEYEHGLKIIWQFMVEGWWNYRNELLGLGLCTEEELKRAHAISARTRSHWEERI